MRGELQNQRTQVHLVLKTFHTRCNKRNSFVPMSVSYKASKGNQKLRFRCRPGCCGYLRKTKTDLDVDDIDAEDKAATELPVEDEGDESDGAQDAAAAAQEILQVSQGDDQLPEGDDQGGFGPRASKKSSHTLTPPPSTRVCVALAARGGNRRVITSVRPRTRAGGW